MQIQHSATADTQFTELRTFRQAAYDCLGNGRAALFDLADAVLVTPAVSSFAELACAPVFRRRWSSLYEALQDGQPDRDALLRLYVQQLPRGGRILLAGDHTDWPRLSAPTLRDRKIVHAPTKIVGNRPITLGYDFSTLSWVPESAGSWALPLLFERISSAQTSHQQGADQLRRVVKIVQAQNIRVVSLWDSEYGCAPFINATADIAADKLFRLRPNLCLWGPPPPYAGRGRPACHGPAFKLREPLTWGQPASKLELLDPQLGRVQVCAWRSLHFRRAAQQPLVVLRIERMDAVHTARDPGVLWLGWHGAEPPPLATWWKDYLRRFAVDHWHRFAKQDLCWTLPHLATPERAACWSDLMPLLTWQLWLARNCVNDVRLPWQKPQAAGERTPGRVRQGMAGLLAAIGTPAPPPKPRGKAPGWPAGRVRKRRERFKVVKKARKKARTTT
jgi:hypothetical protein